MKTCSRCGEVMHEELHKITKVSDHKGNINFYCEDCFRILYPKQSALFFELEVENNLRTL